MTSSSSGSGFGGSVVAARLAEAGQSVCLLERGRRWEAGEYPRSFGAVANPVWDEEHSYGFLDYRVFRRIDVVLGSGVGGGSLHYFNVQIAELPRLSSPDTRGRNHCAGSYSIGTTTGPSQ